MEKRKRVHVIVSGLVQGVFFRDSARRKARQLGLIGWVRNMKDGRVEIVAEGEKIEDFINWARKGPPSAKVENLEVGYEEGKEDFDSFKIKY